MNHKKENKKRKIVGFPKGFFDISRTNISFKKVVEDVTPIEWEKNSKEILVCSAKKKK